MNDHASESLHEDVFVVECAVALALGVCRYSAVLKPDSRSASSCRVGVVEFCPQREKKPAL